MVLTDSQTRLLRAYCVLESAIDGLKYGEAAIGAPLPTVKEKR